jgi:formylglycine-generating enzyme required for sulfatase activity
MALVATNHGSFCIDRLEVKNADYAAFVAGASTKPQADPPECAWNTHYASAVDAGDPDLPVVAIDWCDAYAYCASVGKHLCGAVGDGGPVDFAARDTASAQWVTACSNSFTTKYPYGDVLNYEICNACDPDAGCIIDASASAPPHVNPGATKVGSFPQCGASGGPLDLSGNVWEWEASCDPTGGDAGPAKDTCSMRGGSFLVPYLRRQCLACSVEACGLAIGDRSATAVDVGFRCCKELP